MEHVPDDQLWPLLDRYLSGDASAADSEQIRVWIADDPAHVEMLADFRRIREVAARRAPPRRVDDAWRAVARVAGIATPTARRITPLRVHQQRSRPMRWLAASAVIVTVLGAGAALEFLATNRTTAVAASGATHEYTTQPGQRAEVRLVDGTRVTLAPASRLIVPADFDIVRRDVVLEGRAMLTVEHNTRKPFTVRARNAIAIDVGTRFEGLRISGKT